MMAGTTKSLLILLVLLFAMPASEGATRLTYEIDGQPKTIAWDRESFPVQLVVDRNISATNPRVRQATDLWHEGSAGAVSFSLSEGNGSLRAGQDGRNAIILQEALLSQNGALAFTTSWFDDEGRIIESDILVDRSQIENLGALLTHELGHSLGFDHSALLSSAMYPYVPERTSLRLDLDDTLALRTTYPMSSGGGMISGIVQGQLGPVHGAQVVAVAPNGQPVASTLSGPDGEFSMGLLPPGEYELFAEPLDGPVSPRNFSGVWRDLAADPFPTAFLGAGPSRIALEEGESRAGVVLPISASPVRLNAKWIGQVDRAAGELVLDSMAVEVRPGERFGLVVGGEGFLPGVTELTLKGKDFERISEFQYGANYVWAEFRVAPTASERSVVVVVDNGIDYAMLAGGLRVVGDDRARRRGVRRP